MASSGSESRKRVRVLRAGATTSTSAAWARSGPTAFPSASPDTGSDTSARIRAGMLRDLPKPLDLAPGCEPLERLRFELAHPLGGQAEPPPGLPERLGIVAVDAIAQPDHIALRLGQLLDGASQELLAEAQLDLLIHGWGVALE